MLRGKHPLFQFPKTKLEEELAKQKAEFETELATLKETHKEETDKLQALNEQAQDALQQSMNRLMKMKSKIEKDKETKKKQEENIRAEQAELEERYGRPWQIGNCSCTGRRAGGGVRLKGRATPSSPFGLTIKRWMVLRAPTHELEVLRHIWCCANRAPMMLKIS